MLIVRYRVLNFVNLADVLPPNYFRTVNGVTYVKTPDLILSNPSSQAPRIIGSITSLNAYRTELCLVWLGGAIFGMIGAGQLQKFHWRS